MPHAADDIVKAMGAATAEDRAIIERAYDFAERAHGEEKRKSGEPYIIHPHAIAVRLATLGMDRDTIVAGLLHDVPEDTTVTAEEIEKEFGTSVRFLVDAVTKLSKLKYRGMERHVESMRRLLVATASDIRVIIIKFADRLHNMQTISALPPEKQVRIAEETMQVYVPIAERLGMGMMKAELEDLAYGVLHPARAEKLATIIERRRADTDKALDEDTKDLKKALAAAGLKKFTTQSRIKSTSSLARKLTQKKTEDLDRIYDLFAMRVIVPNLDDCYRALGIVHNLWRPIPGRVKDYIAFPKPNGYRSIHTTVITRRGVTTEVQIRTPEMQQEAEYGVASHFNYATKATRATATATWLQRLMPSLMKTHSKNKNAESPQWLKELTTLEVHHPESEGFHEMLQQDFFAERMFAFTPKGDVIDLPVGATPIDFAYAIHSDVGNRMTGAKVNGKMTSLDTALVNGDVVEIITKKTGLPNAKWLDIAKTAGAKHHVRSALNNKRP